MPFPALAVLAPYLISAGATVGGALLGRQKKTLQEQLQEQTRRETSRGTTTFDTIDTTTPNRTPQQQNLESALLQNYMRRLNAPEDLAESITTGNIQNINRASEIQKRLAGQSLAARGLSFSPAGSVLEQNVESDRMSKVLQAMNAKRMLLESLTGQRLSEASGFLSSLPVGQTATRGGTISQDMISDMLSKGTSTGTATDPGNKLGGGIANLAGILAGLYGMGAFGGKSGSGGKTSFFPPGFGADIGG